MSNVQNSVIFYSAAWCGFCRTLQGYMDKNGIEYDYRDVETGDNEKEMLEQTDGKYLIPTVIIGGKAYQNPSPVQLKELINNG